MGILRRFGRWVGASLSHRYVGNVLGWMGLLYVPLEESVPVKESVFKAWRRPLSGRVGWMNVFGAAALFLLVVLVLTGILLSFHYEPSQETARESVLYLMTDVTGGWLVRGLHHWAGQLLIALVLVHVVRTFFARAYRAPRQLNWVVGLFILPLVLAFQFTGEILPWDEGAYWRSVRANELGGTVPLWGSVMSHVAAGPDLSNVTLVRYFALHVVLLPWVLFFLLGFHLYLVRRHGIAPPRYRPSGKDRRDLAISVILRSGATAGEVEAAERTLSGAGATVRVLRGTEKVVLHAEKASRGAVDVLALDPAVEEIVPLTKAARGTAFFPHHFFRICGAVLFLTGALVILAAFLPPSVGGPADPFERPEALKVSWYFGWFEQLTALLPAGVRFLAPLLFVALPLLALCWPLIDRHDDDGPRRPLLAPVTGAVVLAFLLFLTLRGLR